MRLLSPANDTLYGRHDDFVTGDFTVDDIRLSVRKSVQSRCFNVRAPYCADRHALSFEDQYEHLKFSNMSLRIIATGGTFDKHYDEIEGKLSFAESHLSQVMKRARMTVAAEVQILELRDSLDMTDADRATILVACQQSQEKQIVIIHGTDTMSKTAALLNSVALEKTIVLTGAMVPYEFTHSDALFNFGFACCAAQTQASGVYIAMNGQIFSADNVRKNRAAGVFETL